MFILLSFFMAVDGVSMTTYFTYCVDRQSFIPSTFFKCIAEIAKLSEK